MRGYNWLYSSFSFLFASIKSGRGKFITALDIEIQEAKNTIHEKMRWISRDASCMKGIADERLLVEFNNTMLLLGEDEDFVITLPSWEANIRDIVEIIPPKEFKRICNEIILIRKFLSKFRDMKMAFKVVMGDPAWMARNCYVDLLNIHNQLIPN